MHHLPNIISVIRIILIIPITILLHREAWMNAFILIFVAGFSDALDGFLARAFNWQSRLGAILDPIADKLLLVILFIILAQKDIVSDWLAFLVVSRDVIIIIGASFYHWVTKSLEMAPLIISKINTALQILFILTIMYHLAISPLPQFWLNIFQIMVAATTLISGILYVLIWSGYTRQKIAEKGHNKT